MAEKWKPCAGYEDCYSISNLGRLARTATYGRNPKPCFKIRVPALKMGYRSYHMCKDGIKKYRLAHLLVWQSFKGPIPEGREVNHKNGNRDDPSLTNLELMTRSENAAHSFRVLKRANFNVPHHGSRNGSAKLTEQDIPEIFRLSAAGWFQWQIAEKFGVSQPAIGFILRGKSWRHVTGAKPD
jgi:hypothetical protein